MNNTVLKVVGIVTTIASVGISLVSTWVGDKKTDALIAEKVAAEVAKHLENK